jgi:hypothetical protein
MLLVFKVTVGVSEIVAVAGVPFRFIVWGAIAIVYTDMAKGGFIANVTGLGV